MLLDFLSLPSKMLENSKGNTNYYKVSEVAAEVGVSGQTIKRWRKDGKIPKGRKQKSSGHIVFTAEEAAVIKKFASDVEG